MTHCDVVRGFFEQSPRHDEADRSIRPTARARLCVGTCYMGCGSQTTTLERIGMSRDLERNRIIEVVQTLILLVHSQFYF